MPRLLILFSVPAIFFSLIVSSCAFAQGEFERTWRSGKFEIIGSIKSVSETEIVLKTKTRDSLIAIEQLSQQDRSFLQGIKIIQNDAVQFRLVSSIIEKYKNAPEAGIEKLIELGQDDKSSPYAPFAAGVALATLQGDFKAAKRQFSFAKVAIKRNENVLGAGYHAETRAAINNNIAVCLIKQFQCDKSVEFLLEAMGNEEADPIGEDDSKGDGNGSPGLLARHNRDILLEISSMPSSQLELGKRGRKNLLDAQFEEDDSNLAAFKFPNRYLISSAWQRPLSKAELSTLLDQGKLPMEIPSANRLGLRDKHTIESLQELDAYPDLWCTDCRGSGVFKCRNCTNGRVETRVRKFAGNSPNGSGPMYQWVFEWVRCPTCQGNNHRRCRHCNQGKLDLDR